MENNKRVWLYTRQRGDANELALQKAKLLQTAMDRGYEVVCHSSDEADDWLIHRPGLQAALRHVRAGEVDILMITRIENISHDERRLFHVLKKLQDGHAKLLIPNTKLEKIMAGTWREMRLSSRGKRKGLALPW